MDYNEKLMELSSKARQHKDFTFNSFSFWQGMVKETIQELEKQKKVNPFVAMHIEILRTLQRERLGPLLVKNPKDVEESLSAVRETLIETYKSAF